MAGGWARDGAVQDQIGYGGKDAVLAARPARGRSRRMGRDALRRMRRG